MHARCDTVLLVGFGNPGRLDDGLGPALAERIALDDLPGVTVEADYQLTIEDAAEVARYDIVVFADADTAGPEPFWVKRIGASDDDHLSFSSHSVSPVGVLTLAKRLFNAEPEAYLLGIRGYEFDEFGEGLTDKARANLAEATTYVVHAVRDGRFTEVRPEGHRAEKDRQDQNKDRPCKTENM